jgi:hypothetical protein
MLRYVTMRLKLKTVFTVERYAHTFQTITNIDNEPNWEQCMIVILNNIRNGHHRKFIIYLISQVRIDYLSVIIYLNLS